MTNRTPRLRRHLLASLIPAGLAIGGLLAVAVAPAQPQAETCPGAPLSVVEPAAALSAAADIAFVSTAVIGRLAILEALLFQTLRLHAGETHGGLAAMAQSMGAIQDGANANKALLAKQESVLQAQKEFLPADTTCEAISGIKGLAGADSATWTVANKQGNQFVDWTSKAAGGRGDVPGKGNMAPGRDVHDRSNLGSSDLAQAYRFKVRMDNYCDKKELKGAGDLEGRCKAASDEMVNADIKVGQTMMSPLTYYTKEAQEAAQQVGVNLLDPIPSDPIAPKALTTPAGREAYLLRKSADTRMQMASNAINRMLARRSPTTERGDWAKMFLEEINYGSDVMNMPKGNKISEMELLDVLVNKRFQLTRYYIKMQAHEDANLDRELAITNALDLMITWRTYELMEQLVGIRATGLAMDVVEDRDNAAPGMSQTVTKEGGQ